MNAAFQPVVTLPLLGPDGQSREIEAVVDTGFNGSLILPTSVIAELGLPYQGRVDATLADGSAVSFHVYNVTVLWDGVARYIIPAVASDNRPLLGMALLDGHDLSIQVRDGGRVVIQPAAL